MSLRPTVVLSCSLLALATVRTLAQAPDRPTTSRVARTVVYHPRDLVAIRAKLHYTTLIVLPDGEDVLEATCGDKEFWIVNVRDGLVSVKPAKPGGETNLNVVTASGQLYAFVLTEISGAAARRSRLHRLSSSPTIPEPLRPPARDRNTSRHNRSRISKRRPPSPAMTPAGQPNRRSSPSRADMTAFRNTYPLGLSFPYKFKADKPPFFIHAIFHDDHRTFIQARPSELPSLYELKDGRPNLVMFDVHNGTYVVPKILDSGYLTIGKQRVTFERLDR